MTRTTSIIDDFSINGPVPLVNARFHQPIISRSNSMFTGTSTSTDTNMITDITATTTLTSLRLAQKRFCFYLGHYRGDRFVQLEAGWAQRAVLVLVLVLALIGGATGQQAHAQEFIENTVATGVTGPRSVVAADVNGDGAMDVVSVALLGDEVAWHENDGAPAPTFTERLIDDATLDGPREVHAADLDADGDMDILAVSLEPDDGSLNDNGKVVWFENDGAASPSFTAHVLATTARRARSVTTADVNGDADLDVVVGAAASGEIIWFESDGAADPSFSSPQVVTNQVPGVASVRAGDLDGDGDADVAAAVLEGGGGIDGDRVIWLENQGDLDNNGTYDFTERDIATAVDGAVHIAIDDINGDGALDVVSAAKDENEVAWHENDGAPTPSFTSRPIISNAAGVLGVHVADAEGDGDPDVFAASAGDNAVRAFANDGALTPSFQELNVTLAAGGASSVAIAAIDPDTKRDVIVTAFDADEVLWYKNESSVLPVELADFRAVTSGEQAVLTWRTLSETNNEGFGVERRTDGTFEQIGYVRGAGTSIESNEYRFRTEALPPGAHVFRLRQVDRDGTSTYSEEVEVEIALASAYTLTRPHPNPAAQSAELELQVREAQHVRAEVYDYLGRRVETLHDGVIPANQVHRLTVDGRALPTGAYFVRVVGQGFETTRSVTLVK